MARAIRLAQSSIGLASPNPNVACLLVRENVVLAESAHLYEQRDHAEVAALKLCEQAGVDPRGATAYVTLEPCAHHGRTGPCVDALIAAGIARCVIATLDPNPLVSGRGLAKLRAARIDTTLGILETEARTLNDAFAFSITHHRPLVTLKAALSVEGMLAPPPAQRLGQPAPFWLTSPAALAEVQHLRHASDAILTGIGTVLADSPALTDRTGLPRRRPLLRVILDSHLRVPLSSQLVRTIEDDLLILCSASAPAARVTALEAAGAEVQILPEYDGRLSLSAALTMLAERHILSVLLETGSALNAAFLQQQLVDRAVLVYSDRELGRGAVPFAANYLSSFALEAQLTQLHRQTLGPDVFVFGLLHDPWESLSPVVKPSDLL